jgi:hypothetical protein
MVCRAAPVDGISGKVSDVAGIRSLIAKQQIHKRSMVERRGDVEDVETAVTAGFRMSARPATGRPR